MYAEDKQREGVQPARVAAAVIGAYIVYILIVGLEGTGLHFLELGALRVVLFGALLVFARRSGALMRRLGRFAIGLNGLAAIAYVGGGIGSIVADGWSYDIFAAGASVEVPWYAFVLGLSGLLFAVSTILVGVGGRSAGRLSTAVLVAGLSFPLVFILDDTVGHVAWLATWLVLAVGIVREESPTGAPDTRASHTPVS